MARLRIGKNVTGAPVSGYWEAGDLATDKDAVLYICSVTGTPGTWSAYATSGGGSETAPDATTTVKGIIKLAGDLGGTSAAPTVPGLAGKANSSHTHAESEIVNLTADLASKLTQAAGDGRYVRTVNGSAADVSGNVAISDASTSTKGIVQLSGDLAGTADSPIVPGLSSKANTSALTAHTGDTTNPHAVTKAQVGLGNVDNTSDINKPVSTAQSVKFIWDRAADFERDFNAPTDGTSDATTAMQSAVDTLFAAGGGKLRCGPRTYNITQINWPTVALTSATPTLEIEGALGLSVVPFCPGSGGDTWSVPALTKGTIFKSTAGTGQAAFGGNLSAISNIHVAFKDVIVRLPSNPQAHGIDTGYLLNLTCDRVMVDVGLPTGKTGGTIPQPTAGVYGVIYPGEGNGGVCIARDLTVQGFGVGIQFSEHFDGDRVTAFKNLIGLEPRDGWHAARAGRVNLYWNKVGMQPKVYNASHPTTRLNIAELDSEETDETAAWYTTTAQINDPSNRLRGRIRFHRMKAATGINGALLRSGAAYVDLAPAGGFDGGTQDVIGFEGSDSTTVTPTSLGGAPSQQLRGTWGISSQQLYIATVSTSTAGDLCAWDTGSNQVLVHSKVQVPTTLAKANVGVALCAVDASNYLCAVIASGAYSIQKVDTGAFTNLSGNLTGITMAGSQTFDLKVTLQGKRIRMYVDGALVRSYTLSSAEWTKYSAGTSHGAWAYTGAGYEPGGSTGSRWSFLRIENPVPLAA
jgi:hypothetical protein